MLINRLPAHRQAGCGPLQLEHTFPSPLSEELPSRLEDAVQAAVALACPLLAHLQCVVVTLGAHGVLLCGRSLGGSISLHPGAHKQVRAWKTNSELSIASLLGHMALLLFLVSWQQSWETWHRCWKMYVFGGVEYTALKANRVVCLCAAGS